MSDLYWLNDEQMDKLTSFFPKSHGKLRGDGRRNPIIVIFYNRNGLRWQLIAARRRPGYPSLGTRQKDWNRVVTCYDRCPKVVLSAIAFAARLVYGLRGLRLGCGLRQDVNATLRNSINGERAPIGGAQAF